MSTTFDNISLTLAPEAPTSAPRTPSAHERRDGLRRIIQNIPAGGWLLLDVLVIALGVMTAHASLHLAGPHFGWVASPWLSAAVFCACSALSGLVFGLYERGTLGARSAIVVRASLTLALGIALSYAVLGVLFYAASSRWVGLIVGATFAALAVPPRLLAHHLLTTARVRLMLIGDGESVRRLVHLLLNQHRPQYEVVGHLRVPSGAQRLVAARRTVGDGLRFVSESDFSFRNACPCVGRIDETAALLREYAIEEVVVASEVSSTAAVGRAVAASLEERCRVTDHTTFVEKLLGEAPVENIGPEWFLRADVQNHWGYDAAKRILDVIAAACGLVLSAPLWLLIAVAIRLDSPGPAFYRQIRVGRFGRPFTMYKFRTMRTDAERDGARWAAANDERVTRLGRLLRRSRLDELPQLINILRGDMSVVGPRPERPEFVRNLEELLPHYRLRHLIKPGLTGWAQIHYGYGSSVPDAHRKLCYDVYYLKHRSLELDVAILVRTAGTFLLGGR